MGLLLVQVYLNPQNPVVTICTTKFSIRKFYVLPTQCICFYGSQNK